MQVHDHYFIRLFIIEFHADILSEPKQILTIDWSDHSSQRLPVILTGSRNKLNKVPPKSFKAKRNSSGESRNNNWICRWQMETIKTSMRCDGCDVLLYTLSRCFTSGPSQQNQHDYRREGKRGSRRHVPKHCEKPRAHNYLSKPCEIR